MKTKTKEKAVPTEVTTKALAVVKREVNALSTDVEELRVESAEDVVAATGVLQNIKRVVDYIQGEQDKVVKRLQELVKIEKGRWKPSLDLLNAADKKLRGQILSYRITEQAAAKKAEEQILKRVASGRLKETTAMAKLEAVQTSAMGKSVKTEGAVASFRKLQKLRITNDKLVPREYLVVDERRVLAALKAGEEVPGAELYEEETLAIK